MATGPDESANRKAKKKLNLYKRTDEEVERVLEEVGLERLVAIAHSLFVRLGHPEQTQQAVDSAIKNGVEFYQPDLDREAHDNQILQDAIDLEGELS